MLDAVAGYKRYSFMDGFSGYNQIQIFEPHRWYTTFITDWGTFAYMVMPFDLCNAPATFQRVMTKAFQDYFHKFMDIFLDDFVVLVTTKTTQIISKNISINVWNLAFQLMLLSQSFQWPLVDW